MIAFFAGAEKERARTQRLLDSSGPDADYVPLTAGTTQADRDFATFLAVTHGELPFQPRRGGGQAGVRASNLWLF